MASGPDVPPQSISQSKRISVSPYVASESEAHNDGNYRLCVSRCMQYQRVQFLNYAWNRTAQQSQLNELYDDEFQTEGALALKFLADNESAIRGTDRNSLSADRSVRSGW